MLGVVATGQLQIPIKVDIAMCTKLANFLARCLRKDAPRYPKNDITYDRYHIFEFLCEISYEERTNINKQISKRIRCDCRAISL